MPNDTRSAEPSGAEPHDDKPHATARAGESNAILSLAAARAVAMQANPDIHAAKARLEGAVARVALATSQYYPTIALTHTSFRTFHTPASRNRLATLLQPSQPVPTDIDISTGNLALTALLNALRLPLFGVEDPDGNSNSYSEHSSALAISWLVSDGFVREAQLEASRYLRHAAGHSLVDVRRLIVQAVDAAYFQVQLAEERVRIARADEEFSREQFEETGKLQEAGRATQADVDNFRVRMLAAQADVTGAIGVRDTGRVVLAELMGEAASELPAAIALSPLQAESDAEMAVPEVGKWIEPALANRPDLARQEAVLLGEEQNVRAAKGLFSPVVTLTGSWGFDRSSNMRYSVDDQSSAGAFDVRWELFTGGERRARVREAESRRAEAAAILNRLRLAVQAEVRNAVIDLMRAQEQIRLQRESLDTARENRRMVQAAYVAGKETLSRLNEAQRDFIAAEANLALARIRLRLAWSDLYAAAATYPEVTNETHHRNASDETEGT